MLKWKECLFAESQGGLSKVTLKSNDQNDIPGNWAYSEEHTRELPILTVNKPEW